jgi:hypothetical protein
MGDSVETIYQDIKIEEAKISQIDETISELTARKKVIESRVTSLRQHLPGIASHSPAQTRNEHFEWAESEGFGQFTTWWNTKQYMDSIIVPGNSELRVFLRTSDAEVANGRLSALKHVLIEKGVKGGDLVLVAPVHAGNSYYAFYFRVTY